MLLRNAHPTQRKRLSLSLLAIILLAVIMVGAAFLFLCAVTLFSTFVGPHPVQAVESAWQVSSTFPQAARKYLPLYQAAGKKYGVPWHILAAIHRVETDFGRNVSVSSVGAVGQTQFMDKTWLGWSYPGGTRYGDLPDTIDITDVNLIQKYGGYGVDANGDGKADPYDPADAIYATAKLLAANHRPDEDWFARTGAVWQYNHDYEHYVLLVKKYADAWAVPLLPTALKPLLWPVPGGKLTSSFGLRLHPLRKVYQQHEGIDIGKELHAPIVASEAGTVVASRKADGYGWIIVIDHQNQLRTLYAHMEASDVKVHVGQTVAKGQIIALMGQNGWSTGPHLHFEVYRAGKVIDPLFVVPLPR
jgi:murein DD-endopeptidase MepM/ murein hydrolase activator NlpD